MSLKLVNLKKQNIQSDSFPLARYLLRESANSLSVTHFRSFSMLSVSEQLLCYALSSKIDQFASLAKSATADDLNQLAALVTADALAGLMLDFLSQSDFLSTTVRETTVFSPEWAGFNSQLSRSAAREAASFQQSEGRLLKLLHLFREYEEKLVWLKGTALSRTVYKRPHYRLSSDFDLIAPIELVESISQLLIKDGYERVVDSPALCPQLGAGPVLRESDLLLSPNADLMPVGALAFKKSMEPIVEIKLDALELGLKASLTTALFNEAEPVEWNGSRFRVPNPIHHLLILCTEFHKDGFSGWRRLADIHLLCTEIENTDGGWSKLYRLARNDAVMPSAWASLCIARDRLSTKIPDDVLSSLAPSNEILSYTVNPRFVWNSNSLPMLMLNAAISADSKRKWSALRSCLCPSDEFMREYYGTRNFLAHWLLMLLPAGLVRRSFGKIMWQAPTTSQSDSQESHPSN